MRDTAIILLGAGDQSDRLLKMVETWPKVAAAKRGKQQRLEAWARLTGLPRSEVERLAPVLLENEIVMEDGTVAEQASILLAKRVADLLTGTERGGKR